MKWSADAVKFLKRLNNFHFGAESSKASCVRFVVGGEAVGVVRRSLLTELGKYPDVFEVGESEVAVNGQLGSYDERSRAVARVLEDMRRRRAHVCLLGWRDELYEVGSGVNPPVMRIERAAVGMFGVGAFGAHMNGFVVHSTRGLCLWIARRSRTKATFPGKLDNMVAGGVGCGIGVKDTIVKECEEEAGIPEELARLASPVGIISYVYEDERGIEPHVQYCFDLQLPEDFQPVAVDGEVDDFTLCSVDQVKELVVCDDFKPNSAAVTLHFLVRRGLLDPDHVPDYVEICQLLHHTS